jgi:alpha-amylase
MKKIVFLVLISFLMFSCTPKPAGAPRGAEYVIETTFNNSTLQYEDSENKTMLQYFEWNYSAEGILWKEVSEKSKEIKESGIDALYLPPATKGWVLGGFASDNEGYSVYDLYDLGEFMQHGSDRTKYGTKDEYIECIEKAHEAGLKVYADIVLNHKIGAMKNEPVLARPVDKNNRNQFTGEEREIAAWTKFEFNGRKEKYSDFKWNWTHFTGVDWDDNIKKLEIYLFSGKEWAESDTELGNYDFLLGCDIDHNNPEVIEELIKWGDWYTKIAYLDGYRLDAVKHMDFNFFKTWLGEMREKNGQDIYAVGEYFDHNLDDLIHYRSKQIVDGKPVMDLFDFPLVSKFSQASNANGAYSMNEILDGNFSTEYPADSVMFVENHDTQPGRYGDPVTEWFKPHAYAITLLRAESQYPMVFYLDYKMEQVKKLIKLRKTHAYGNQISYFDDEDIIGWTRLGNSKNGGKVMGVIMTDNAAGSKWMFIGEDKAGVKLIDAFGNMKGSVKVQKDGFAKFKVDEKSVSVWIEE